MNIRLQSYFDEGEVHIQKIKKALKKLPYPFYSDIDEFEETLDMLAFRFSKLQSLIGEKLFREYLKANKFDVEGKSFLEILKEIEKEGIVDIDSWDEFRKVRNFIFHEYPLNEEEKYEKINFLIEKSLEIIEIFKRLKNATPK
jgi:hypothetical protein